MKSKLVVLSRNILSNLMTQAAVLAVAFLTTPFILRNLGETNYGLLIFLTTVINFLLSFDLGLAPAYIQSLSEQFGQNKKQTDIFFTGFFLYILVMGMWTLLLFFLTPFIVSRFLPQAGIADTAIKGLRIFCWVLFLGGLSGFASYTFQALQKFYLANLKPLIIGVTIPLGTIILLQKQYGLTEIFYLHLFAQIFVLALFIYILTRSISLKPQRNSISKKSIKKIAEFARWKFLGQLAGQLKQKMSRFFVTGYLNLQMLTYFYVPQNLAERFLSLQPNITTPIFTMAALLKGRDRKNKINLFYRQSVKLVNIFLVPLGIFIFFYGDSFLSLWLGPEFAVKAGSVLKILILGICLNMLNGTPTVFLEGIGQPAFPSLFSILLVAVYIAFSFWLIPVHGITGAALAFTLTYIFLTPYFIFQATKKILGKVRLGEMFNLYLAPVLTAFLSGWLVWLIFGYAVNWALFCVCFGFYLSCFYLFLVFTRQLGKEEKDIFLRLIKQLIAK